MTVHDAMSLLAIRDQRFKGSSVLVFKCVQCSDRDHLAIAYHLLDHTLHASCETCGRVDVGAFLVGNRKSEHGYTMQELGDIAAAAPLHEGEHPSGLSFLCDRCAEEGQLRPIYDLDLHLVHIACEKCRTMVVAFRIAD